MSLAAGSVTPGYAGMGAVDPYAVDYDAPYFRRRMGFGRHRRQSLPGPGLFSPAYNDGVYGPENGPVGMYGPSSYGPGIVGSPYNGAGATSMYGPGSLMPPTSYSPMPGVTTVPTVPGQTTVIQLPRHHHRHRSSSRHQRHHGHHHHHRRARSVEPVITTSTGGFGQAANSAARAVGSAVGGVAGGAAGLVGGAVGGFARGAVGGASGGLGAGPGMSSWPAYTTSNMGYPGSAPGYGYGTGSTYRYY